MKIVIAGLGGVGGYYGGLMSRKYKDNPNIKVYFFARGAHLEKIQKEGLLVKAVEETFLTKPILATNDATQIGEVDFILICSKSYDLEELIKQTKPCIGSKTVILPLLNGINITQNIRSILPENEVLYGCVYIIARLVAPGIVQTFGSSHELFLGTDRPLIDTITNLGTILQEAGIRAKLLPSSAILTKVWEKFLRISTFATATAYYDCGFSAIVADSARLDALRGLMGEVMTVARAEKIALEESLPEKTIAVMGAHPANATSSMHSDFVGGRRTELATLAGIVIELAEKHGIAVPVYSKMHAALVKRQ